MVGQKQPARSILAVKAQLLAWFSYMPSCISSMIIWACLPFKHLKKRLGISLVVEFSCNYGIEICCSPHCIGFLSSLHSLSIVKHSQMGLLLTLLLFHRAYIKGVAPDMLGSSITSWIIDLLFVTILVLASFNNRSTREFCSLGIYCTFFKLSHDFLYLGEVSLQPRLLSLKFAFDLANH